MHKFFPFLGWVGDVTPKTLAHDLGAGATVAVMALPQGVAFAMIAGMPPIYGLYTAIVLPIVAGLFGSSRHMITGPTIPLSIVVFSAVSQYAEPMTPEFVKIALTVTLMVGILQLVFGLARLGALVNFVSHTVVIGFTSGVAILIATNQLKYLFGIPITNGSSFLDTWRELFYNIEATNLYVLLVGVSTLISAIVVKKIYKLAPNLAIAMVLGSIIAYLLGEDHGIATLGQLPTGLPGLSIPMLDIRLWQDLFPNAFAIALLGLIGAVAIARSIATKSGQRINGNQEFIGQGLANIIGSFSCCYAGSGSFTRSGVNYEAGATTPLSSIFTGLLLVIIVLFVSPLTSYLPIPAMSGIILLVAFNLIDFHHIRKIIRTGRRETTVLSITFAATLVLELQYAIYLGVIFSLIFYLNQTSKPRFVELSPVSNSSRKRMFLNVKKYDLITCPQLMIYRVEGSLFFGAIESVSERMNELYHRKEKHLLLVANNINLIDTSGAEFLVSEVNRWRKNGKQIYFSGFKLRSREYLQKGGYWDEIGREFIFANKEEAVSKIFPALAPAICQNCPAQLFLECPKFEAVRQYTEIKVSQP